MPSIIEERYNHNNISVKITNREHLKFEPSFPRILVIIGTPLTCLPTNLSLR